MSQISQIKKIYHAAIYVRLSKEDGAVASHEKTESNSIANQKSLIRDFLENKNDIEVVQEYVDDGFSGSNFERPAFQMMLEDIKKGKIDCVVTKDLSRFGREYIDSGMYIERLFPAMGVRFIAINDGIDSGEAKSQSDEIIIPFKNLINDKSGKIELAEKAREWHYSHVKEILQGEYYIGNIVHGKQRKALDTGRKNVKTDASTWQRIENVHEPIIDKDTFYKTRERMEHIKKKHLEASKPKADVPNKPDNILVYKTKCACCGGSVLIGRHHTYSEKFYYKCKNRRKLARLCENKYSYDYSEVMDSVFSVIRQHMSLCVEKTKFVQKMNSRKENVLQYDIYTKQIAKLQNDVRRITANKSGLYEDYREQLITAEELCQYQREYESRVNEIEAQITELLHRRSLYEKEFHIDEGWEETVNKYMAKRKLTKELVDAFVSEIVFYDGNIEVKLLYDDFLKELLKVAEEREVSSNG